MKSIKEISESIGISKVAIYKKIKYSMKEELQEHVFKEGGKTLVDEVGEDIIISSLRRERMQDIDLDEPNDFETPVSNGEPKLQVTSKYNYDEVIGMLKEQLVVKDNQIKELMKQNIDLISTFKTKSKTQAKPAKKSLLNRIFNL